MIAILPPQKISAQYQEEGTKRWTISAYGGISMATAGRAGGFWVHSMYRAVTVHYWGVL
jgi:hypothetical protein